MSKPHTFTYYIMVETFNYNCIMVLIIITYTFDAFYNFKINRYANLKNLEINLTGNIIKSKLIFTCIGATEIV